MTVINISRQPHSFGDEIAQKIAEKLNYQIIDKSVINNKVNEFHCNFSDELSDLANQKEPGFFKHFFKNPLVYNCLIQAILFEEASLDNVVIIGRGGHFILNHPFVLNIRVVAPFEVRCLNLENKEGVNHSVAEKLLEREDHDRDNFIQYLFKKDISDPDAYDLIFNSHKLGVDLIVSTILDYVKKFEISHPVTDEDKDLLRRLSLEKRVEATIRKKLSEFVHLKVDCEKIGHIRISGFASDETERTKIFKLAQECHGVTHVDNDLDTIRLHKP